MSLQHAYGRRDGAYAVVNLGSGTDGVMADLIAAVVPPDPDQKVLVQLDAGDCWGASTTLEYAMRTGDLTQWHTVILQINPSSAGFNGRGGAGGLAPVSGDGLPGKDGGNAFEITSDIYMDAATQERAFGGGGGGGSGGWGGDGEREILSGPFYTSLFYWSNPGSSVNPDELLIKWDNVNVYSNINEGLNTTQVTVSGTTPEYTYYRGDLLYSYIENDFEVRIFAVSQGYKVASLASAGGFGGRGAGPCVEGATVGAEANEPEEGAGKGGTGGAGGWLEQPGQAGEPGAAGTIGAGSAGGAGGQPGTGIVLNGGVIIPIDGEITFIGPDIVFPLVEANVEMEAFDASVYFDGVPYGYNLLGTWPAGISIDENGLITGTPTEDGSFAGCTVNAFNSVVSATSNNFIVTVDPNEFTAVLLLDVPLADEILPVDVTTQWPFETNNDFLMVVKFAMPELPVTGSLTAVRFTWNSPDGFLWVAVNEFGGIYVDMKDGTTFRRIDITQANQLQPGDIAEVKVYKSSTRGFMAWLNNVKDNQVHDTWTPDLSAFLINTVSIGSLNGNAGSFLGSQMFCFQVYEGVMSDPEIESVVTCDATEPPPPPQSEYYYLDDVIRNVVPNAPGCTLDYSHHKHPKIVMTEGGVGNNASTYEWCMKYDMFGNRQVLAKGMDNLRAAGHQHVGIGFTPFQENEWKEPDFAANCGHGWGVPFKGTTPNGGDNVDDSGYGFSYGGSGSCGGGIPAGWFAYHVGSTLSAQLGAGAGNTVLQMDEVSNGTIKFRANKYLCIRNGLNDWDNAEHCRIVSVNTPNRTITVVRGHLSNMPVHPAGSYVAEHQLVDLGNASYWMYNLSDFCYVDGNGETYRTFAPQFFADHYCENISGTSFPGLCTESDNIMYDVDTIFIAENYGDINNDGVYDKGFSSVGARWYEDGAMEYYNNMNTNHPNKLQIGGAIYAGGFDGAGQEGQNGTQMEAMFTGFGTSYDDYNMSAHMIDLAYREHYMPRGPVHNHMLHKQSTATYDWIWPVGNNTAPADWSYHIVMGACAMENAYMGHQAKRSNTNPGYSADMWYDLYAVAIAGVSADATVPHGQSPLKDDSARCLAAKGWLGDPVGLGDENHPTQSGGRRRRQYDTTTFNSSNALMVADFEGNSASPMIFSNVTPTIVTDDVFNGTYSLHLSKQINYSRNKAGAWMRTANFAAEAGKEYTICFAAKAGRQRRIRVTCTGHNSRIAAFLVGTEWTRHVMTFKPSSGTRYMQFELGEHNEEMWFDDIFIFEGSADHLIREFENGIVLVNLSQDSFAFDLGDGEYQRIQGSNGGTSNSNPVPQNNMNRGGNVSSPYVVAGYDSQFLVRRQP